MTHKLMQALLLIAVSGFCAVAQHKVSVSVREGRKAIRINLDDPNPPSASLAKKLTKAANYRLAEERKLPADIALRIYNEVAEANEIMNEDDRNKRLAQIATKAAADLGSPSPNLIDLTADPNDPQRIDLRLVSALEYGKTYELTVNGLDSLESPNATRLPLPMASAPTGKIVPPLDGFSRNEIRVVSNSNPVLSSGTLSVNMRTLTLRSDAMGTIEKLSSIPAKVDENNSIPPNELAIKLSKRLKDNQAYQLIVTGLTDGTQPLQNVTGPIKFPGLPSPPDDPKWDVNFSSAAAVKQKPEFNLAAKINPRSPERLDHLGWLWQPSLTVDVGLGATKSNNSITFASPFVRTIIQPPYIAHNNSPPALIDVREARNKRGDVREAKGTIPHYKDWSTIPWLHLSDALFSIGPKLETDRKFKRLNTIGNMRFDLHFPRMMGSIKQRRKLLKTDLKEDADLVVIDHGFSIVPYVSFDLGAHANNETITTKVDKQEVSLQVPRHGIFRSYGGFKGVFEWRTFTIPTTLTMDEAVVLLASREKIGYSTDKGVFLRQLRGFHHHFKTALDFAFDPAKHYSFNITFENGRLAPNFEYLNKLTAGIRVLY